MSNRDISECTVPELIELYGQRQRISLTRGKEEMMLAANAYSGPLAKLALRPFHRPPAWQAPEALLAKIVPTTGKQSFRKSPITESHLVEHAELILAPLTVTILIVAICQRTRKGLPARQPPPVTSR